MVEFGLIQRNSWNPGAAWKRAVRLRQAPKRPSARIENRYTYASDSDCLLDLGMLKQQ